MNIQEQLDKADNFLGSGDYHAAINLPLIQTIPQLKFFQLSRR